MYHFNGCKFGFFVQRNTWGATVAQIISIEGVKEGEKIPGKSPYFKCNKVYSNIFKIDKEGNKNIMPTRVASLLFCPATYSYKLINFENSIKNK